MSAIGIGELEVLMGRGDYVELKPDGSVVVAERGGTKHQYELLRARFEANLVELQDLKTLLNTPETEDFDRAVPLEAAHQVQRWASSHDAGKSPTDWFWLIGYLAGKALAAHLASLGNNLEPGEREFHVTKAKHHTISTAAALRNWHAHIRTGETAMRPGTAEKEPLELASVEEPR